MELGELAERLEKASGPDQEIDGAICLALGWTLQKMKGDSRPYYRKPGVTLYYMRSEPPAYTTSIDAALTLVPEGWTWDVDATAPELGIDWTLHAPSKHGRRITGTSEHAAIALCIASLRARGGGDG